MSRSVYMFWRKNKMLEDAKLRTVLCHVYGVMLSFLVVQSVNRLTNVTESIEIYIWGHQKLNPPDFCEYERQLSDFARDNIANRCFYACVKRIH